MNTLRVLALLILPTVVAAQEAADIESPKRITFTTDADRAAKREIEKMAEAANLESFIVYALGKTYWYVPGPGMNTSFYQRIKQYPYTKSAMLTDRFTPDVTVSFRIQQALALQTSAYGISEYAYRIEFEDGTMAYMKAETLGRYSPGAAYDSSRTGVTVDPKATTQRSNDKLFGKDPEELSKAYAVVRAQEEREAERLLAEQAAARQQEEARATKARRMAVAKPAKPKKGGVYIGMTKQQVLASNWGRPSDVNRTTGSFGTHEQWVYGGSNYLYFENGVLTAIQN